MKAFKKICIITICCSIFTIFASIFLDSVVMPPSAADGYVQMKKFDKQLLSKEGRSNIKISQDDTISIMDYAKYMTSERDGSQVKFFIFYLLATILSIMGIKLTKTQT